MITNEPHIVFRIPSTEEFKNLEAKTTAYSTIIGNLSSTIPSMFVLLVLLKLPVQFQKGDDIEQLAMSSGALLGSILATYLIGILNLLLILSIRESLNAQHSRKTNQAIGYAIQSPNEDDIKRLNQIRNLPLVQVTRYYPFEITNPRKQFVDNLQVVGSNELVTVSYTLDDVTQIKVPGLFLGAVNAIMTYFYILATFVESDAATVVLFLSMPIHMYCSTKLLKAAVLGYSTIPGAQYTGCFFSKSFADFKQQNTSNIQKPLLTEP